MCIEAEKDNLGLHDLRAHKLYWEAWTHSFRPTILEAYFIALQYYALLKHKIIFWKVWALN